MKIARAWRAGSTGAMEAEKEITEERAAKDLANAHGDNAVAKLKEEGKLETRFATYRYLHKTSN